MSKFAFRVGSKEKVFVFLLSSPEANTYQVAYRVVVEPMSALPCFHPCVRPFTLSNINISATSGLITKCYQKHHLGMGSVLGFGPDRIKILVSLATDSSHRVLMGKTVLPLFLGSFTEDPFHL